MRKLRSFSNHHIIDPNQEHSADKKSENHESHIHRHFAKSYFIDVEKGLRIPVRHISPDHRVNKIKRRENKPE